MTIRDYMFHITNNNDNNELQALMVYTDSGSKIHFHSRQIVYRNE